MKKLCLIFNYAPLYRESIYKAIDAEFDCDWYFGVSNNDIKGMDLSLLKNVFPYKAIGLSDKFYWQKGILKLIFRKRYQNYFMLAETRSISAWLFFFIAFIFFPKKKINIWTHGWYGKELKYEAKMKLWLYKRVQYIFLYGNYAKKLLVEQGVCPDKLFVIHNSLHYEKQIELRKLLKSSSIYNDHFRNENKTIIFIGRLTQVKKLDILIDAISFLATHGENYNLIFVGNGVKKSELQAFASERGLENVWFYGECYDEKTNAELIYNADLCVSPGNVGLTAIHTMMYGTPVITHNNFKYQMPEFEAVISGKTGDFFKYNDKYSLAETISSWFSEHRDKREFVRAACYKEIDEQWNTAFQIDIIKSALQTN